MNTKLITLTVLLAIILTGCVLPTQSAAAELVPNDKPAQQSGSMPTATNNQSTATVPPTLTILPTETSIPSTPTAVNVGPNPESIPDGFNPLTGLQVLDPELLKLPAVLISITNFPISARPQSGLSFAAWVYELYISEGMTRFLSVYYGDYPHLGLANSLQTTSVGPQSTPSGVVGTETPTTTALTDGNPAKLQAMIGPIRSGRLPYAYIRDFYRSSCLVYAGATVQIRNKLKGCSLIFGSDSGDINSAMLDVTKLLPLAKTNQTPNNPFNYSGNFFSETAPSGGAPTTKMEVFYSYFNQGQWQFNPTSGQFLKFEDFADGSGKFRPMTDRLNGQQLAFANVIVLYADHTVLDPYILDVNIGAGQRGKAIIFRDGQKYNAVWTTLNGEYEKLTGMRRPLRFEDAAGNPFPLKPGQSWVHIFTPYSYLEDKGDGVWQLRFVAPAGSK